MSYIEKQSTTGINAKNTGTTTIYTTENGTRNFYPSRIRFICTAGTLITIVPTISIGTNASSYNNILAATSLTGLTSASNSISYNVDALVIPVIAANTAIIANVTVGSTATTMTIEVHIFGDYE